MDLLFGKNRQVGFTLIEISLVLLLFGSAVGGLLSFFSVGLRQENSAMSDTAQAMFAFDVLGQIEANAAKIDDFALWNDEGRLKRELQRNLTVGDKATKIKFTGGSISELLENYPKERTYIRYMLDIIEVKNPISFYKEYKEEKSDSYGQSRLWRAVIWVTDRRDGYPEDNTPFVVDLLYQGGL